MRMFLFVLYLLWQAATSPFYLDPALEVEKAKKWLDQNVSVGDRCTLELINKIEAEGFEVKRLQADAERDMVTRSPWDSQPIDRLYMLQKTIYWRPSIGLTNVRAIIALNDEGRVVRRDIVDFKTWL